MSGSEGIWRVFRVPTTPEAFLRRPQQVFRQLLGCYGQSQRVTPRLDALAASGTCFERAYCNLPVCGPSRASVMTEVRPTPDRFVKRATFTEEDAPEALPLHTYFKQQGYHTLSNGKVFDRCWIIARGGQRLPGGPINQGGSSIATCCRRTLKSSACTRLDNPPPGAVTAAPPRRRPMFPIAPTPPT